MLELGVDSFLWEGKPVFAVANEENKKLENSLKQKKMDIQQLRSYLDEHTTKFKLMQEHYNDVYQEMNYTQQLQRARQHELEIEDHMQKLINRERGQLIREIKEIANEINILQTRQKSREATILEQMEKTENLKSSIHWDQKALEEWLLESVKLEEDKVALIKYTHQDDSKIKELTLLLERLSHEAKVRKNDLDDADTDVFAAQTELDRVQEEFRNAHNERKDIISDWEKVLNQIQRRNSEIEELSQHMASLRAEENVLRQKLEEQEQFFSREFQNNKILEQKVFDKESLAAKLRIESVETLGRESDLKAELETLRNISSYIASQLRSTQEAVRQLDAQLEQKNNKLQEMDKERHQMQNDLNSLTQETFDAEYYTQQMDKLLQQENDRFHQMQNEYAVLQNLHLKNNQELKEMCLFEKTTESKVKGAETANRNLSLQIRKVDNDRLHQQAMMYKVDYNVEQMEQRFRHMAGESNDEERRQLETELSDLKRILDEKNAALSFLTDQVKCMMEKITLSVKTLENNKKENGELAHKIDSLEFYISNSQKALKASTSNKEALLVEECLIKLQLKRFRELLRQRVDSVFSLQKHQLEFETLMKERQLEINNCKELLQTELHIEEQERYKLSQQVQECKDKAAKWQTRYKVFMNALGLPESGDNIQSELLMKAEEEKMILHRQRDELISTVSKSEQELHALENTVWLVRSTNSKFRETLHPPDISDREYEKIQKLDEQLHTLVVQVHQSEQFLNKMQQSVKNKENILNNSELQVENLKQILHEKRVVNENISKEIAEQKTKLMRADRSNSKLSIEMKDFQNSPSIDEDINIHLLRELRQTATTLLYDVIANNPELTQKVKNMFKEAHVPFAPKRVSAASSRCSSTTSVIGPYRERNRKEPHGDRSYSRLSDGSKNSSLQGSASGVITPSVITIGSNLSAVHNASSSSEDSKASRKFQISPRKKKT